MTAHYPHQIQAKQLATEAHKTEQAGLILAHAMNAGKCRTTVEWLAEQKPFRTLIVSPASVRSTWLQQFAIWAPQVDAICKAESGKETRTLSRLIQDLGGILIVSYELLGSVEGSWDVIVPDEAHYLASRGSKRTLALYAIADRSPDTFLLPLSGTPIPQTISDLWPLLNLVAPREFPDYWAFMRRYALKLANEWAPSGWTFGGLNPDRAPELYRRVAPFMHRVTRDEFAHLLPKFSVVPRFIRPKRSKFDWDDEASFAALLEMNSSQALDETIEVIEQARASGSTKFIVGCWLNATAEVIAARLQALGLKTRLAHGHTDSKKREKIREEAAADTGEHCLVVTIASVKEGLNNLTWAEVVGMPEFPYRVSDANQFLARFGRGGTTHATVAYPIICEGTPAEKAAHAYVRRQGEINLVIRPGLDETRTAEALTGNAVSDKVILESIF